jgi:hypothetical protein
MSTIATTAQTADSIDYWVRRQRLLAHDPNTGRVFVRHEPNLPSGGQVADIEIGAFLIAAGNGPEKQELLRLIGTLA